MYRSGVKFDERAVVAAAVVVSLRTKISGQEGSKISGQEGSKLGGGGESNFFNSLRLFKNIESRWDISGFTKRPPAKNM